MTKFPADAPLRKVIIALEHLGFKIVRNGNHIAMLRKNSDGTRTPLTMPTIRQSKGRPFVLFSPNPGYQERIF